MDANEDFILWAKSQLKTTFNEKSDNAILRVCYFMDGEPYIGGFPALRYSDFINDKKRSEKVETKKTNTKNYKRRQKDIQHRSDYDRCKR